MASVQTETKVGALSGFGEDLPKEIWFDLDGTLLLSRPFVLRWAFIYRYFRNMIPLWGVKNSIWLLRNLKKHVQEKEGKTNLKRMSCLIAKRTGVSQQEAEQTFVSKTEKIFAQLNRCFKPALNSLRVLQFAQSNGPVVLATNPIWPVSVAHSRLNQGGMDKDQFDLITSADNMSFCKPSLKYYEQLLKMRSRHANEVLLIGNDLRKDGIAARLGIRTFIVLNGKASRSVTKKIKKNDLLNEKLAVGTYESLYNWLTMTKKTTSSL